MLLSMTQFLIIISNFCGFSDKTLSREQKELCSEHMYNCVITGNNDGTILTQERVELCKSSWSKKNGR